MGKTSSKFKTPWRPGGRHLGSDPFSLLHTCKILPDSDEDFLEWNLASIIKWRRLRIFGLELLADALVLCFIRWAVERLPRR